MSTGPLETVAYAPRGRAESASPYLICLCPPERRAAADALALRWGLVPLSDEDVVDDAEASMAAAVDPAEPWSAAELGAALEEAGLTFSLFLAATGELDNYLWLYTPALGRFESAASADGTTVLVPADDLDKAVASCDDLESLRRSIEELSGRAHREVQGAVAAPSVLEVVRVAAHDYEVAKRRRDAAIVAAREAVVRRDKPVGSVRLQELAEAANLSVSRISQIVAPDPPGG